MRKLFRLVIAMQLLCSIFMIIPTQKAQAQPGVEVSYQTFYDNLSPYGQWVNDPQYGNVFVPTEGADFRPYYSRGHWVMTDYGNTWVSDDPWGWACYHYGRWTYDSYYGWVWIPGSEWAPAWVDWRYGGGVCGWAPLGPGISIGVGIYNCPDNWWVFVGPQYLYRPDFFHYWRGPAFNGGFIRGTALMTNVYRDNGTHVRYNFGPRAEQIQAFTHQAVPVYHISGADRPGAGGMRGNAISMYRPAVNRATMNTAHPANVMRAPQAIGRAQAVSANRQPAFRSAVQHGQAGGGAANHAAMPNRGGGAQAQSHAGAQGNHANAGASHGNMHQGATHHQQNVNRQPQQHAAQAQHATQQQHQQPAQAQQHNMGGGGHMGGNGGGGGHMGGNGGGHPGGNGGGHPGGGGGHPGGGGGGHQEEGGRR